METVSIGIPSALYAEIYAKFGEEAGTRIVDCLHALLEAREQSTSSRYRRPRSGTITGRVWEIADEQMHESGSASREAVVIACVSEGINVNTANTQYSHWLKHST